MLTHVRRSRGKEGGVHMGSRIEELLVCNEVSCGHHFLKCFILLFVYF